MDKFDELLKQLQECKEIKPEMDVIEMLPETIFKEHFEAEGSYKTVKEGLQVDKHRWYETSITVIEIYGRFLGCQHVSGIFSESMDVEDCGFDPSFFEMVKVPSFKFKVKE